MRSLILNGKYYAEQELIWFCKQRIAESNLVWEKDYCAFILEWLTDSDEVQAQTSGSTGTPKSICLSKQKMKNSARITGEFFGFQKHQSALLCLSTQYIAGKMMIVRAFQWQLNLITVAPDGHPLQDLDQDIDFAAMIPLQVGNSLSLPHQLNRVKNLLIGGGAVDAHLEEKIKKISTQCFLGYGMTETVSHVAMRSLNGNHASETYAAMGNASFSLDSRNCLCIYAPAILKSKLITNDVVELLSKKNFKWLGRYDNVVNSGGVKLYPEQIEKKLETIIDHPFFICALPDERLGEKLVLLIETTEQESAVRQKINSKIKDLLPKYEQAREIYCVPIFARSSNGKLQRVATLSSWKLLK